MTIRDIQKKYHGQISSLDLEILISHILKKRREAVLSHPEQELSWNQKRKLEKLIERRIKKEPISYLTEKKEFFGLNFLVNKHTLIPRPETELIIEDILSTIPSSEEKSTTFLDIGTGSGNIIISLASRLSIIHPGFSFIGSDISRKALHVAKKNSKIHGLKSKIKFFKSHLLKNRRIISCVNDQLTDYLIITANLPYLSEEIYTNSPEDVVNFEPKSALLSPNKGLWHYEQLLNQIESLPQLLNHKVSITTYLEISPEQKTSLEKIIENILPKASTEFKKDLAGKWRICKIVLSI
jgi:release factor glutamine methyltransferase